MLKKKKELERLKNISKKREIEKKIKTPEKKN